MMQLSYPLMIVPRLLPGVMVCGAFISVEPSPKRRSDGKPAWRWYVDIGAIEFSDDDLAGWGDHREMLGALLSFLSACGEGRSYARRTGRESENADLFAPPLAEWCEEHHEELAITCCEVEENTESLTYAS
jgi:hypothetical protein